MEQMNWGSKVDCFVKSDMQQKCTADTLFVPQIPPDLNQPERLMFDIITIKKHIKIWFYTSCWYQATLNAPAWLLLVFIASDRFI